jgi:uncharacterized HAD superfamily protein
MNLGIDIDGTIDECPEFFRHLSHCWTAGQVYIVTHRLTDTRAKQQLSDWGIRFDAIHLAASSEDKARVVKELDISLMFDDSDDVISALPPSVKVLKMRHADNFDHADGRWLYGLHTGKLVGPYS